MLEPEIGKLDDAFLRSGLTLLIDGMPPAMIRDVMYREVETMEEMYRKSSRVFESAGGYAPTIGILGAVLGLIQVMSNVTDPSKIGGGIAVAFIATIYGVGSANLLFIPLAEEDPEPSQGGGLPPGADYRGGHGDRERREPAFSADISSAFLNKPER
ncbi:MAG: MotA/TolQ/ExbB proton channel family protein [Desulfobacterales bacterium]|nr:MotA/TolQ/ExbB proton channel family protein [Desulfobacterales bacterium]